MLKHSKSVQEKSTYVQMKFKLLHNKYAKNFDTVCINRGVEINL